MSRFSEEEVLKTFASQGRFASRWGFYWQTWTGRLLAINFVLFLLISFSSGSFWAPGARVLSLWGAKDPIALAYGEWWRLLTPIFLHFGILHFVMNALALKVVGAHIEPILGAFWFLFIYICSGVAGNILSAISNISIGAGASGAIFGLIGVGVVFEQIILRRQGLKGLALGPFGWTAILNIAFAILFNLVSSSFEGSKVGIDNAAHMGGFGAGIVLSFVVLLLRKNRLMDRRPILGWGLLVLFCGTLGWSASIPLRHSRIYEIYRILEELRHH